jgi:hypothetical protein
MWCKWAIQRGHRIEETAEKLSKVKRHGSGADADKRRPWLYAADSSQCRGCRLATAADLKGLLSGSWRGDFAEYTANCKL